VELDPFAHSRARNLDLILGTRGPGIPKTGDPDFVFPHVSMPDVYYDSFLFVTCFIHLSRSANWVHDEVTSCGPRRQQLRARENIILEPQYPREFERC
jgi:hypothetical protein